MIRRAARRPGGAGPLVTAPYALALRPAVDDAGLVWERGVAFVPPAERGAGRMTKPVKIVAALLFDELDREAVG